MNDMPDHTSPTGAQIRVAAHGPYLVSGVTMLGTRIPVRDQAGEAVAWRIGEEQPLAGRNALCRCGHSAHKPFCDSTHRKSGFDGACTADRAPGATRRKAYPGAGITMTDDESLCAGYEYCDRFGGVWRSIARTTDPQVRDALMQQVSLCPSGRLQYVRDGAGAPEELPYAPTIATIPDGPLWVLGPVAVVLADGFHYEPRNRQLLCRCGASGNKPFCDGSHAKTGFKAP
ncbi:MAG TPA: CDGSH iron-sulfur domain-containing protein [Casimicrobiaceae bacterium]|nr:CDGSH iron-sulfur domain-containing protein [Casimicrobiaceae bacterium]